MKVSTDGTKECTSTLTTEMTIEQEEACDVSSAGKAVVDCKIICHLQGRRNAFEL